VLHLLRRGQPRRLRPEVRTLVRLGLCYYLSCARAAGLLTKRGVSILFIANRD
jgi:hypothetical protein